MTAGPDGIDSRAGSLRRPAGRGWWAAAAMAVLAGTGVGVAAPYAAKQATALHATSNRIITSTGGTFRRMSGRAPTWALPDLHDAGRELSLTQFRGRPLVLNFWASWCPPCRAEMPALAAAARATGGHVAFVGIDANDARSNALSFASKTGARYPLAYDANGSIAVSYGVAALPTTFFISPTGHLIGEQFGGMTAARLAQLLRATFGAAATTPSGSP